MVTKLLRNIVTGGINDGFENERIRKIVVINLFSFIGLASMFYFGINSLFVKLYSHAIILFFTAFLTILNFIYLRITKNHNVAGQLIIIMMIALNIYLFISGGQENTGILWFYVFPLLCLFTVGIKKGLIYIFSFFLVIVILLFSNVDFIPNYPDSLRGRLIASFLASTLMSVVFEKVRELTYTELQKHKQNLELIVRERTMELEYAKEKAEESDRLKSSFLANMSHEIRTPLNAIVGFTNLIVSPNTDANLKQDMANHIMANSNSLIRLIEDIIDISKIDSGQFALNISEFDLRKMINGIISEYKEKMDLSGKKHLSLLLNIESGDEPIYIQADSNRLHLILSHLLDNALKFTDDGSIELGVSPIRNNEVQFYVRDTGIGFSKEDGKRIFERFITGRTSRQRIYRGTGLGLSICNSLVDLMHGHIWFESTKGIGSTFYFTIQTDIPLHEISATKTSVFASHSNFENLTILIAEDEESNYIYISELLAHTNATILHADNGKKAVEMCEKHKIDLILMDIKMPVMNGLEATKIIKSHNNKIPIIAQTAFTLEMDEKVSVESGCDAYIAKPIEKDKLIELISELSRDKFNF